MKCETERVQFIKCCILPYFCHEVAPGPEDPSEQDHFRYQVINYPVFVFDLPHEVTISIRCLITEPAREKFSNSDLSKVTGGT